MVPPLDRRNWGPLRQQKQKIQDPPPRHQLEGLEERCKLPQCRLRGGAPVENEFGALESYQKATGGNHFEYSEYHVLKWNDQNLALANMTVSDGVSRPPLNSPPSSRRIVVVLCFA